MGNCFLTPARGNGLCQESRSKLKPEFLWKSPNENKTCQCRTGQTDTSAPRAQIPGSRKSRKETGSESQPRPPQFPSGSRPPLPQPPSPGLGGPALGRLSPPVDVLCGVNGASAKAGGGAERSRGCGNPAARATGRPGLCLHAPTSRARSHGNWPRPCWGLATLCSPGVGG